MVRILPPDEVVQRRRKGRTLLYLDIKQGLWTKPVRVTKKLTGWPEAECDALINATIAGKSEGDIRDLVSRLEAERQKAA